MSARIDYDYDVETELLMVGWRPSVVVGRVVKTTTSSDGTTTTTTEEVVDSFRHIVTEGATP